MTRGYCKCGTGSAAGGGWLVVFVISAIALTAVQGLCAEAVPCNAARPSSATAAVKELLDGNERWASGAARHPGSDFARRECVAKKGQTPFAAILSCSDSRVPPELLFDEGVGDIFVVRVAGNSIDKLGEQSLDYAISHLGVETIMVLGHQNCGAVNAAVDSYPSTAPEFLAAIYRAIVKAKEIIKGRGGDPDDKNALRMESIDQHVIIQTNELRSRHPFKEMVESGKLRIVGGRYDLDSGKVTMLIQ